MSQRTLWALAGTLYRLEEALGERDLRPVRWLVAIAQRLVLAELDDVRRRA